jgi:cobyrinic acid a,c-diamide synthase
MKSRYPRIIVTGLKGGSGKTLLSLCLITAWREKGLSIVPYKKGPDYIDAGWLSSAAKHPCYNLDLFLMNKEIIISSFKEHFGKADCAVIEGNRGLYDGMDSKGTYSTAELSKLLRAPVILILDCTKVSRTAGAIVYGLQKFDKKVDIRGVVLNMTAGPRHKKVVSDTIERYCNIPVLGSIPKLNQDFISERHMGLTPFQEQPEVEKAISYTAKIAKKYLDLDMILQIGKKAVSLESSNTRILKRNVARSGIYVHEPHVKMTDKPVIGIIRDTAFQFYYPENLEELKKRGINLLEISAIDEKKLPEVDALYIGGGFPETHAIALAKNTSFRKSLRKAIEDGLPVYAECGGLMYLGKSLVLDKKTYPMAGVFPITFCLEKKPQAHGYTIVEINRTNPFYPKGTILKGHEFHYSRVVKIEKKAGMRLSFRMKRGQGLNDKMDGLCYKNTLATYTHLHSLGSPEWSAGLLKQAVLYRKKK